jgi:hypothetical protein
MTCWSANADAEPIERAIANSTHNLPMRMEGLLKGAPYIIFMAEFFPDTIAA